MTEILNALQRLVSYRPGRRRVASSSEPSSVIFGKIRWQLTFWYSAVLALALLILGIALYAGVRRELLNPIDSGLHDQAAAMAATWQESPPGFPACPHPDFGGGPSLLWACYDPEGKLLTADRLVEVAPEFTNASLVASALRDGQAQDAVHTERFGTLERYALRVTDPQGHRTLGVATLGTPIGAQLGALDTLFNLLLLFGVLALLCASAGGLFLAGRALLPARLAYSRQRDFIADASHELRTPLTLLRADAEVLLRERDRLAPDHVEIVEDVVMEAGLMASLANHMLDLARLDSPEMHIEQDVVDLSTLMHEIVRRASPLAAQQQVALHDEVEPSLVTIGDRLLIEQALLILVENAIKYNRSGGAVTVRGWSDERGTTVEIRDTGIGIEAEHLPHLGQRFYRVDKARSREGGGAGLGISIVQSIAARHRGHLEISSEPGQGTSTRLRLPR